MIDQDKRDIRLYQEILLPDGDLYSEGQGRMRRFRWQNIGNKCWDYNGLDLMFIRY